MSTLTLGQLMALVARLRRERVQLQTALSQAQSALADCDDRLDQAQLAMVAAVDKAVDDA